MTDRREPKSMVFEHEYNGQSGTTWHWKVLSAAGDTVDSSICSTFWLAKRMARSAWRRQARAIRRSPK
jgi:hypothetical protein